MGLGVWYGSGGERAVRMVDETAIRSISAMSRGEFADIMG
jgi:hypothetical protein